jgi:signal transduction histidine kinase
MRPLVDAKLRELSEVIEMRRRGDPQGATARVIGGEGKRLTNALRVEMRGVVQAETEMLAEKEAALGSDIRRVISLISALCVGALMSALAFGFWIRRESQHRVKLKALELENAALVTASRQKSEFLATMSHELRTPLNAIIGFAEVLHDGLAGTMNVRQQEFVGTVLGSSRHLLSLINDILDLAKVEAGQMTLDLEAVEVSSLFANSLTIVKEKAAVRRVRLVMDAPAELSSIHADARKVKQILYNLLSNALKFTPDGGKVALHACRVSRAEVGRLSGSWKGRSLRLADSEFLEFLEISVTDTGVGISTEGLELLFTPFRQIDSGLARRFDGTGLGLTLVKSFAELHGGAVAVESAPGEGSRFAVWLPLRTGEGA